VPERETLYRVLQVDPAASPLVIQAAYRVLARIFHPDLEGDDEEMKRINHAWAILGDPLRRAEYDRRVAGRHSVGVAGSTGSTASAAASETSRASSRPDDHAGPPQGEAAGPLLRFGRYEGWTLGQIARVDPPFLEWLRRVPTGRQYKDAIDVALQRAEGARRMGIRSESPGSNDRPVHAWMPGAPTKVR